MWALICGTTKAQTKKKSYGLILLFTAAVVVWGPLVIYEKFYLVRVEVWI